jgi:hypothetical protein
VIEEFDLELELGADAEDSGANWVCSTESAGSNWVCSTEQPAGSNWVCSTEG